MPDSTRCSREVRLEPGRDPDALAGIRSDVFTLRPDAVVEQELEAQWISRWRRPAPSLTVHTLQRLAALPRQARALAAQE